MNERKGVEAEGSDGSGRLRRPDRFVPEGHEVLEVRYGPGEPVDKDVAIAAIRTAFTGQASIEELAQQAAEEVLAAAEALSETPHDLEPGPLVAPRPAPVRADPSVEGPPASDFDFGSDSDPVPSDPAFVDETDDGDPQPSS